MRSAPEIMNVIESAEFDSQETFFIYKPTFDLIIKPLNFSLEKTREEIEKRIIICKGKREQSNPILKNNWQLIIDSLRWVIEERDIDPLESRRILIPFAK